MKKVIKFIVALYFLAIIFYLSAIILFTFPTPRGHRVNSKYFTYYKSIRGIYYISVRNSLQLLECGTFSYLTDADEKTFVVLNEEWAKDKEHVWHMEEEISGVDVASFHIDKSGLAKDRYHVFIDYGPSSCGIDVNSAEYFMGDDTRWMRDKYNVYFEETRVDVDRNTIKRLGNSYWYIDKNKVFTEAYSSAGECWRLIEVDSLQHPIDTLESGSPYLRNGRNIIYHGDIILKDIEVTRFEYIGVSKCVVNDMLFLDGKQILKDSLNVNDAKFYFYGHISADKHHVFYGQTQLNGIDAATFHQTGKETFEDRLYTYKIKDNSWAEDDPFVRTKKRKR